MLNKFRVRLPTDLEVITTAVDARDANATARLAHSLKGSAGNLAAGAIRESAAALEQAARQQEWAAITAELAGLLQHQEQFNRFMDEVMESEGAQPHV
jgi:HPt (histidine-containing phosphotransfer) domain-containing protein